MSQSTAIDSSLFIAPAYTRVDLREKNTRCQKYYLDSEDYQRRLMKNKQKLFEQQEMLTANETWSLLLVFQAMDAGGKDEAIKYILDCFDPQSCLATQSKPMTDEELRHSYLKRAFDALPGSGQIGVFNRSYYEQVVVERVHPESISPNLPESRRDRELIWQERYEDISAVERHWARNGTRILKFFLHISPEEQKKRLLDRIEDPDRSWEFSLADVRERKHFDKYLRYYEEAIFRTHTEETPWYIIPSDDDKNARLIIAQIVLDSFKSLKQTWPEPDEKKLKELAQARKMLAEEE